MTRRRSDEDFAREVEAHVQLEADRLVEDGLSPDAARLEAHKRFGNATLARERYYYSRRSRWFDELKQDVRTSLRGIRRYPIACVIAVISLGGGIGATTITLLLRNAIFVAPPPLYQDPEALAYVRSPTPAIPRNLVPANLYQTWLDDPAFGGAVGAMSAPRQQDVRAGDQVVSRPIRAVTPNLFTTLGVRPLIGTPFDEWTGQGDPPVMLSAGVWASLFQQRQDVVGQSILIDNRPYTVIGVMPPRFWYSSMQPGIWIRMPVPIPAPAMLDVVVRRPATMSDTALLERLRAGVETFAATLPADQRQVRVITLPMRGTPIGNGVGAFVVILLTSAVFLTLLIACTNVAVLMMAQWTSREHEIAIRASLGGSRGRIVRSLLTESTIIATAGGLLGIAVTFALRGLAIRNVPTAIQHDLTIDWMMLVQAAIVTMTAGLLTGVAPAIYETRRLHVNPLNAIRGSDRVRQRWRHALVVFEIATTVALLVSTGAMLASYSKSLNDSPGFATGPILSARVDHVNGITPAPILERIRSVPGVVSAEVATTVPYLAIGPALNVSSERLTTVPISVRGGAIGPEYFSTLGVAMRAGRVFNERDTAGNEPVAIVNDVLAGRLWPSAIDGAVGVALGREVFIEGRPHAVVGVVTGYAVTAIQPARPMAFTPFAQLAEAPNRAEFIVRASGDPAPLTQTIRREVDAIGGGTAVAGVNTIEQIKRIIGQEIIVGTFPLFPLIATGMLLTAAGIYGVLAFAVSRRATELAVRVAVGATGRDVLRLVAGHSLRMLGAGSAIGIALTFGFTRIAQGRGGVFDSPGWQPFVVPMILILLIGTIATLMPLRRALRINPTSLLRTT
jgi:putative ABC transport system permease protein